MYISEQLLNPSERRLRLATQLGVALDVFALDVGSILLDSLVDLESAKNGRDILARNIAVAAVTGGGGVVHFAPMTSF